MRSLFTLIAVVAVAAGGYFLMQQKGASPTTASLTATTTAPVQTAWIEVTADPVYLSLEGNKTPLKSGDTVTVGSVIETGATGTDTIHFPDGSLARMDVNTTLTLSAVSFNTADNSIVVKMGLIIGRVWSKVIGLATPASSWEVQTSNTVATVRGTAFGVGHKKDGTSWVLGSQHTIAVAPVDPKTGNKIAKAEILLNEDRLIQLTDTDAAVANASIGSSTISAKVTPIIGTFKTDAWIHASQAADKKLDAQIDVLRAQGANDADIRNALLTQDVQLQNILKQKSEVVPPVAPAPATQSVAPAPAPTSGIKPTTSTVTPAPAVNTTVTSSGASATAVQPTTISASRDLSSLIEGDTVQFKAMTGTKDVTADVTWSLTGPIGSISSSGLFTALLDSSVSEFGVSIGFVSATLKDGTVVKGPLMYVSAKVVAPTSTAG